MPHKALFEPLYARVAEQLLGQISAGEYPVGSLLPPELELAALLGVSRHTLRAALQQLEAQGRISRKKNVGTRVEATPPSAYVQSLSTVEELVQWAKECERRVLSSRRMVMDIATSRQLGCASGSEWLLVQSLRFEAADQPHPVAHTRAYIDARYAAILPQIRKRPAALMADLLQQRFGLVLPVIEQQVQAIELDAHIAQLLIAADEKVAIQVMRRYLNSSGNPVLITVSVHPASRFALRMRMQRQALASA